MIRTATIIDGHRYILVRRWGTGGRVMVWVMLNPSTADHLVDDPTIKRCIGYAKAWGYDGFIVVNCFTLQLTDSSELELVGTRTPLNTGMSDAAITLALKSTNAKDGGLVVCGWGPKGAMFGRDRQVLEMIRAAGVTPHYLKLTKGGHPGHPLYLKGDLKPEPFPG